MFHCKAAIFWIGLYYDFFPEVKYRTTIYWILAPTVCVLICTLIYLTSYVCHKMEARNDDEPRERPGYDYCIYCDGHTDTYMFHSQVYGTCVNMANINAYLVLQGFYSFALAGVTFLTTYRIIAGTPYHLMAYFLLAD